MVEGPISPEGNRPVYKVIFTWYCLYQTATLFLVLFDYNSWRLKTEVYATCYILNGSSHELSFCGCCRRMAWQRSQWLWLPISAFGGENFLHQHPFV
jgi:hypothetical protein